MSEGFTVQEYRTIAKPGKETIIIKKSEFISYAHPVESEASALQFIESIRKQHWDATHNCYAYVIGQDQQWQKSSDDGEPSGTAGRPILEVIKKRSLTNVAVVVTRYFGGIMLGAGGLIRAYGQAAGAGIEKAGVVRRVLQQEIIATVDYTWIGKLENELYAKGFQITDTQYTDTVSLTILANAGEEDLLCKQLTDWTNGQAALTKGKSVYTDFPC